MTDIKKLTLKQLQDEMNLRLKEKIKQEKAEQVGKHALWEQKKEKFEKELLTGKFYEFVVPGRVVVFAKNEKEARDAVLDLEDDEVVWGKNRYDIGAAFYKARVVREVPEDFKWDFGTISSSGLWNLIDEFDCAQEDFEECGNPYADFQCEDYKEQKKILAKLAKKHSTAPEKAKGKVK